MVTGNRTREQRPCHAFQGHPVFFSPLSPLADIARPGTAREVVNSKDGLTWQFLPLFRASHTPRTQPLE